jgi:acetyl esterase/lipase
VLSFGHSQGGHAALFAAELAKQYAPDLQMLGVTAVAPAADLEAIERLLASVSGVGGYFVMSTEGLNAAYPGQGFESVLTPDAASKAGIVNTTCSGDVGKAFGGPIDTIVAKSPLDIPALRKLIHRNSAGNRPAGAPLMVAQGDKDMLVVKPLTDAFVKKACAAGDSVDYRVYPGAGHGPVIIAAAHDIVAWFADRVRGDAARSTCGQAG